MQTTKTDRRTSSEIVFDYLYDEIVSLRMLPGAKISEVEIASRFSVSRQPVRDAFSRLGNLGLLHIRPQRATEVRRFSSTAIQAARFVRTAVEVEVLQLAARAWDGTKADLLEESLEQQEQALVAVDGDAFHRLDYSFHRTLCHIAGADHAFETIAQKKEQVDRLCVLSLMEEEQMGQLYQDHIEIVDRIAAGDASGAVEMGRRHLSRLDTTVAKIHKTHGEYFED